MEVVAICRVVAAEHLVVVFDGCFQSASALQVQPFRSFGVLVLKAPFVLFFLVGRIGEDGGHFQVWSIFFSKLLLELVVVHNGCLDAIHGKDAVEALCLVGLLLLFYVFALLDHILNIQQTVHRIDVFVLLGLGGKGFYNVACDDRDSPGVVQGFFRIDAPHLFAFHIALHLHGGVVIHMETKHIIVAYGVDDGVGVQGSCGLSVLVWFASEELCCGGVLAALIGVYGEDGCTCEAKHHVALQSACDELVHFSKLASVAFVEDEHDVLLLQDFAELFVTVVDAGLHQVRQLLNGGDDDVAIVVLHLPLQHAGRGVRVGAVSLEVVVLLHRLVVQVFPIDHEEHLLDFWHLRGQLCRLE